jgi:hypothetical protein
MDSRQRIACKSRTICPKASLRESVEKAHIGIMNITLPADQEHWLKTRIANGEFQSVEDAIRQLIAIE